LSQVAAVAGELLTSPEGRSVRREAPALDRRSVRRVAAVVQVLLTAGTWQALRDCWGLDGREAAEVAASAITLLLERAGRLELMPRRQTMILVRGVSHIAVITDDLDRFIAFYGRDLRARDRVPRRRRDGCRAAPHSEGRFAGHFLEPVLVYCGSRGARRPRRPPRPMVRCASSADQCTRVQTAFVATNPKSFPSIDSGSVSSVAFVTVGLCHGDCHGNTHLPTPTGADEPPALVVEK